MKQCGTDRAWQTVVANDHGGLSIGGGEDYLVRQIVVGWCDFFYKTIYGKMVTVAIGGG